MGGRYSLLLFLLLVAGNLACLSGKRQVSSPAPVPPANLQVFPDSLKQDWEVPESVWSAPFPDVFSEEELFRVVKGDCIGRCPFFELSLSNGAAYLVAFEDMDQLGAFRASFSPDQWEELQQRLSAIDFTNMPSRFPENGELLEVVPSWNLEYRKGRSIKRISVHHHYPESIQLLLDELTNWVATLDWQPIDDH
jgi:hypothetical protein